MSDIKANYTGVPGENNGTADNDSSFDMVELLYRLLANWKIIVLLVLVAAIAAGVITTFFVQPKYSATATIYVVGRNDSVINMTDLQIGQALTTDYIKVFGMWEVHEQVITNLDLPYTYTQMQKMLSVTNTANTRMIDITVKCTSAELAAQIANEYAEVGSSYIAETMSTVKPNLMSKALKPAYKCSPNRTRSVILAAVLGAIAGIGYVVLLMLFDDKYKTSDDIRTYAGLVTIALVPSEENITPRSKKSRKDKKWKR